ncbi:hypothetical protein AAX28_00976 [Arcobacter porcinus]|uniref:Uncharacterized protein n=1 Tax=Arcobacter porcinus TaxID=1935204 RepID=A0ABX2YF57_9BACT|nr:hypothetical protein AAX28_00976 [Arcobacter porcinus]
MYEIFQAVILIAVGAFVWSMSRSLDKKKTKSKSC